MAVAFMAAFALGLFLPLAARAQQTSTVPRVGILSTYDNIFEKRMHDLGWVQGQNVTFVPCRADTNETTIECARKLVRDTVSIILTSGTPASLAAKQATTAIPIVFYSVGDPVGVGLVSSLARPGGNITGISGITYKLGAKRLELLLEIVPRARLIGVLLNRTDPTVDQVFSALRRGMGSANVRVEAFYVERASDIETVFQSMRRRGVGGALVQPDRMFWNARPRIVTLATESRVPTIYAFSEDVKAGGLISYGASFRDMQTQAIAYIDRILKGAKPADLPIQEPTKFELAINLNAAKVLGFTVPAALLLRADQVIE